MTWCCAASMYGGAQSEEGLGGRERLLGGAEALADHPAEVVVDDVLLGSGDLGEPGRSLVLRRRCLDEEDVRSGGHGVGVLDIERGLAGPALTRGVGDVGRHRPGRLDHRERRRRRKAEGPVEGLQVATDGRRAERVHDDDGLTLAGDPSGEQRREVVRPLDLGGLVAGDVEGGLALRRGGRARPRPCPGGSRRRGAGRRAGRWHQPPARRRAIGARPPTRRGRESAPGRCWPQRESGSGASVLQNRRVMTQTAWLCAGCAKR